ncbi:MAG: PAS domain S-box protein [Bacteroidales bacterium]|nr:PAS domain S-box protein [Candidatus Latescibacterota bacterium]
MKYSLILRHPYTTLKVSFTVMLAVALMHTAVCSTESSDRSIPDETVRIGVRAHSGIKAAFEKWGPTTDKLSQAIPGYTFELVPIIQFDAVRKAVSDGTIDFVLTNPAAYVELEARFGVTRILTLKNLRIGGGSTQFAGVFFTRADRTDIESISDIRGHSIMGVHREAFGGWWMALRELKDIGIDPFEDCSEVLFAPEGTQPPVIYSVLRGEVDIGTIRTGIIEGLIERGELAEGAIKVLGQIDDDLPFIHSTRSYPEWAFAALRETPDKLAQSVTIVLLSMDMSDPAAITGNYTCWTIPHDYSSVHEILRELHVGLYKGHGEVTLKQFFAQHLIEAFALLGTLVLLSLFTIYVIILNRRLHLAQADLLHDQEHLEQLVDQRTTELRVESDKLKSIFGAMEDGVYIVNQQYDIEYVNPVLAKEIGAYDGRKCYEYFIDRKEKCPWCKNAEVFAGKTVRWEYYLDKTGKTYDLIDTPLKNSDGSISKLEILRDITDLKRAEESLQVSEEKYRALYDNAPLAYQSLDENGRFIDVNPAWLKTLGYKRENVIGKSFAEFLHPDWNPIFEKNFPEFKHCGFVTDVQFKIRHKDGHFLDIAFEGCIGYSPDGSFRQTYCVFQDITRRKQDEEERERLMSAIEQAAETIVITDTEGTILYVNPAFELITGYKREEAIGQNPKVLKSGEHDDTFYKEMWSTLRQGDTWTGRFVNKKKDGTLYNEEAVISPVRDTSGRTINYVAVKRDITKELKLEEQLHQSQKMESVGRLAGGVAHDFNNMLSVILGYVEIALSQVKPTEPLHTDLEEIQKAAQRSADTTRQLLAFARKQTAMPKILNLNETVSGMLKMLRRLIGEDIDLILVPGTDLWLLKIDPNQVDQILANLCINARAAITGVGKVTIETENTTFDETFCVEHPEFLPGDYVMFAVSDDGCGMDKEVIDHLFEPFFTTKDIGEGTGLGLATVYGIIKQNGGFISTYSKPGEGTTFRIYLPRHTGRPVEKQKSNLAEMPGSKGETVLLVEDEEAVLKMGQTILKRLGYNVLTASSPSEAIGIVEKHSDKIHLLMTDVVMPEINGRDLAERLQSITPELKCLFVSGYTANVIVHRGILEEGVHFLQKPFSMQELAFKVREILDSE